MVVMEYQLVVLVLFLEPEEAAEEPIDTHSWCHGNCG